MRFRMVLCSQNDTFMPAQRIQRNPRSASSFRADDEQHRSIGKIVIVRKPPRSSLLENRCLRGNPGSSSSAGVIRTNRILIMARTASVSASRCIHAPINGSDALNGHFGCMSNDVSSRLLISWRSHPSHGPLRNKSTCTHNGHPGKWNRAADFQVSRLYEESRPMRRTGAQPHRRRPNSSFNLITNSGSRPDNGQTGSNRL